MNPKNMVLLAAMVCSVSCISKQTQTDIDGVKERIVQLEKDKEANKISLEAYTTEKARLSTELTDLQSKAKEEKLDGWRSGLDISGVTVDILGKIFGVAVPGVSLAAGVLGTAIKKARESI